MQRKQPTTVRRRSPVWTLAQETYPVLLTGGCGLLMAGFALEYVEGLEIVERYSSLVALIPILLGLKCNLEMTLASRLGTAFHLGFITADNHATIGSNDVILSNAGVTQVQAMVISVLSVLLVEVKHWVSLDFDIHRSLFLLATAVVTASVTTMILGLLTTTVLYYSTKYSIDPDNVLGPIVASAGDLLAILNLVFVASLLSLLSNFFLVVLLIAVFVFLPPLFYRLARRHQKTVRVLHDGWRPLLLGLLLSSIAGFFLEDGLESLDGGISIFIPLINGIGGNLGGIFSSKVSSGLHKKIDNLESLNKITPVEVILTLLPIPTHAVFLLIVAAFFSRERVFTGTFVTLFLLASVVQVAILLQLAKLLIAHSWRRSLDPDNHVVPYLTALGDAIGTTSLVLISFVV